MWKKVWIPKKIAYYVSIVVNKHKRELLIIFLLIEVSGHGSGFALFVGQLLLHGTYQPM